MSFCWLKRSRTKKNSVLVIKYPIFQSMVIIYNYTLIWISKENQCHAAKKWDWYWLFNRVLLNLFVSNEIILYSANTLFKVTWNRPHLINYKERKRRYPAFFSRDCVRIKWNGNSDLTHTALLILRILNKLLNSELTKLITRGINLNVSVYTVSNEDKWEFLGSQWFEIWQWYSS